MFQNEMKPKMKVALVAPMPRRAAQSRWMAFKSRLLELLADTCHTGSIAENPPRPAALRGHWHARNLPIFMSGTRQHLAPATARLISCSEG